VHSYAAPTANPDSFGRAPFPPQPVGPGGYSTGQPAPEGLGSSIARGLGTGLAVGAGVVAAEEIGRRIFEHGHEGNPLAGSGLDRYSPVADSQLARDAGLDSLESGVNQDMGGRDFGITDGTSWDDGGGVIGGDDWN